MKHAEITGKYLFSDLYGANTGGGIAFWVGLSFLLVVALLVLDATPIGSLLLLTLAALLLAAALRDTRRKVTFFLSAEGVGADLGAKGKMTVGWDQAMVRERPTCFLLAFRLPRNLYGTGWFVLPKRWMTSEQIGSLNRYASTPGKSG